MFEQKSGGLVPTFRETATLPQPQRPAQLAPGTLQAVHFTMAADQQPWILTKIEQWFADRDEVILVATGLTHKAEQGYIVLEWEGMEIDPLFLAILEHESLVDDYSVYTRTEEAHA